MKPAACTLARTGARQLRGSNGLTLEHQGVGGGPCWQAAWRRHDCGPSTQVRRRVPSTQPLNSNNASQPETHTHAHLNRLPPAERALRWLVDWYRMMYVPSWSCVAKSNAGMRCGNHRCPGGSAESAAKRALVKKHATCHPSTSLILHPPAATSARSTSRGARTAGPPSLPAGSCASQPAKLGAVCWLCVRVAEASGQGGPAHRRLQGSSAATRIQMLYTKLLNLLRSSPAREIQMCRPMQLQTKRCDSCTPNDS